MPDRNAKPTDLAKPTSTLGRLRGNDRAAVKDLDWDSLLAMIEGEGGLIDASQLGDGYHLLQGKEEKKKLVGQPLVVVDWRINPGRFGGFATLHIKTQFPIVFNGTGYQHFIVNDGGTGIARTLRDMDDGGPQKPMIVCRKGLRVSEDYEVMTQDPNDPTKKVPVTDPATGKPVLGTTFYLDTSL